MIGAVVLTVVAGCGGGDDGDGSAGPPPTLVTSPIDVSHLTGVSKFRSCAGHDFSPGVLGHGAADAERARSMKHYLQTDVPIDQADSVDVFAPVAGTIEIQEETFPLGKQVYIHAGGWSVRLFHIDPSVADGAVVAAGDKVGAIPPANAAALLGNKPSPSGEVADYEFDIAVTSDRNEFVSIFDLFAPDVAAAWATQGFTKENAIVTKDARDAAPCELAADGENFADKDFDPDDWVQAATS